MSDDCTFFLSTPAERRARYLAEVKAARQRLLADILAVNHACVHPLNSNYIPSLTESGKLMFWGSMNGLVTAREISNYYGDSLRALPK